MKFSTPDSDLSGLEQDHAAELSQLLFAGMTRADQRRNGLEYVFGLLATPGRKTVRSIANCVQEQAAYEQRLHHFISRSTWSSRDVLGRLADHLQASDEPRGWLIRPMIVEKHGDQSVGVKHEVVPCLGKAVNHQHVLATWFMGTRLTVPTDWRMVVPRPGATDDEKPCPAAGAPERNDSPTASAAAASLIRSLRPVDRTVPVIMDGRETDIARVISSARRKGIPFLLRVPGSFSLLASAGARGTAQVRARRLAELVRSQGRPVAGTPVRIAARTPVRLPGGGDGPISATLLSVWSSGAGWAGVWLTDLDEDLGLTVARTDLVTEADEAFTATARSVGAVDYEGRSYEGWYHHMAMVSVAHAVRAQARSEEEQLAALAAGDDVAPAAGDPGAGRLLPDAATA